MFTISVRYSKSGILAMNLKAHDLAEAREKALHMQSQAFYVEIKNGEGQTLPLREEGT